MSLDINPASEVGKALHRAIQSNLAERGWASADDDLLAEFVVVMLQNHKTAAQVSGELAELVGADYDASFVSWLWQTAEALLRGEAPAPVQEERRSASPARMRSPVRERESHRSRSPVRNAPRGGSSYVPQHQQAPPRREQRRPEPERGGGALFARALGRAGRQEAAPFRSGGEEVKREYAEEGEQAAHVGQQMGNGLPPPRAPRGMNAGLRDYAAPAAPHGGASGPSILSRFAVPDPRASAFTPASQGAAAPAAATPEGSSTSLLARLDPMLPLNALPAANVPIASSHTAPWPSTPSDAALCRYGLRCTNPLCAFSHASAAAIASSSSANGMAIDEPLVLNAAPCRFQAACIRADCERSHVSPAQAVLAKKNGSAPLAAAAPAAGATQECRYGARCTRADCRYAHPGKSAPSGSSTETCRFGVGCTRADCKFAHPQGRTLDIAPPDEEMRDAKHVSERLRRFAAAGEGEGEVERIIPGEA